MLKGQIERRGRIDRRALVIGADIGKEFNALALMDSHGHVLKSLKRVYNDCNGYQRMMQEINQVRRRKGYRKVLLGLEPTGHYWRKLAHRVQSEGIRVVFVKTTSVGHQRGLDQSSRAKSDLRDASVIANLVREGKYCDTKVGEDVYQALRRVVKYREGILRALCRAQNRLVAWLDDYFPELRGQFSQTTAKGLRGLLRAYPAAEDVREVSCKELSEILSKASRRRVQAEEKARRIKQAAAVSIGIGDVGDSDRLRLRMVLDDLEHFERQQKVLEEEMARLLGSTEYGEHLLSVKGIGPVTAAVFLGELGDPRNFRRAKQIISYSGLDPFETESGQFYGRRRVSKEGRFLLRATLYRMAVSVVNHHPRFRSYYRRKLKGGRGRPVLKKKEALCAVAIKLVKLLFALMRDGRGYEKKPPEAVSRKAA